MHDPIKIHMYIKKGERQRQTDVRERDGLKKEKA